MLIRARRDRSRTLIAPVGLLALAVVVGLQPVQPAIAQDAAAVTSAQAQRLDVQVQSDGRLVVVVVNAPITDVIGAVAGAAGMDVSIAGPIRRAPVSVEFHGRSADEILIALMNAADINYLITARRIVMGAPTAGAQPPAAEVIAQKARALEPRLDVSALDLQRPVAAASGPDEWPEGVEPVNFGAPALLPQTREALLLEVNGSAPVTLPASATPNVGPPRAPDHLAPVFLAPATAAGSPGTAPVPVRLQAPPTIRIPAPVVVEFPAPPRP